MDIELAKAIVNYEDHEDECFYKPVTPKTLYDRSRWSVFYSRVYRDGRDGSFWEIRWSEGATEMQAWQDEEVSVSQVYPHEVTKTEYLLTPSATDT